MRDATDFDPTFPGGDGFSQTFSATSGAIAVIGVLMAVGIIAAIVVTVYRSARMVRRGQNPLTIQEDLARSAQRAMDANATVSPLVPTDARTREQRLAELDDLHARGVISDDEHRTARAEVLRG